MPTEEATVTQGRIGPGSEELYCHTGAHHPRQRRAVLSHRGVSPRQPDGCIYAGSCI